MGNESSSPRNRYDDDTIDGTSVFSENTGITGDSRDVAASSSDRIYRSSSNHSGRGSGGGPGNALGAVINGNLIDAICGKSFFEDDEDEDDEYYSSRSKKSNRHSHGSSSSGRRRSSHKGRDGKRKGKDSYDSEGSYESIDEDRRSSGRSSKSKRDKENTKTPIHGDTYTPDDLDTADMAAKTSSNDSNGKHVVIVEKDHNHSFDSNGSHNAGKITLTKPLASAFAKRCYFTKAGIGPNMQHFEGITLSGNIVLMLASAMKLKGCPTICDEDLRRVEQTFPNQFSRLPDELLLSSGWRRISKYCHFSGKPIPDGVPFFHSRERCHPNGGYYFLLASSIGMEHPSDVEPLTLDMLILLQTDFPTQCDQTPPYLIEDPSQWTLVTRFCFFSGGPINIDEDVFYKAEWNNHPIYMLAFLSPNMTPEELYRLNDITGENALKSVADVEEVETVYDLTERDFEDLRMYHLGPCRALPDNLLVPSAWEKVLPQHFMACRESALARAFEYEVHAQEAVAKAGKMMMGLAASRDLMMNGSHGSAQREPAGYKYDYDARSPQNHVPVDQNEQSSYVEMHQIGDSQGQYTGYSRSFGEDEASKTIDEPKYNGSNHNEDKNNAEEGGHGQSHGPHSSKFSSTSVSKHSHIENNNQVDEFAVEEADEEPIIADMSTPEDSSEEDSSANNDDTNSSDTEKEQVSCEIVLDWHF